MKTLSNIPSDPKYFIPELKWAVPKKDVERLLGCARSTVNRLCAEGHLIAIDMTPNGGVRGVTGRSLHDYMKRQLKKAVR